MAQRSISEMKTLLDENALVSPALRKQVEAEIREAEGNATKRAEAGMTERYNFAIAEGQAIGQGLCEVRDSARRLAADLRAGRLSAAEGTKAWNDLRSTARRLAAKNERHAEHAAFLEGVEADPVGYIERIDAKYGPHFQERTRPNFSL